ncbi:MAG: hypothetical protein F4Z31_05685 [Gemmatimonadetes bacterium]|nr:hypothetical protein [Gemmatimonadota bacterium]MYJ10511.1 hypothetical protein [Gemmatimonadota bacterium]
MDIAPTWAENLRPLVSASLLLSGPVNELEVVEAGGHEVIQDVGGTGVEVVTNQNTWCSIGIHLGLPPVDPMGRALGEVGVDRLREGAGIR